MKSGSGDLFPTMLELLSNKETKPLPREVLDAVAREMIQSRSGTSLKESIPPNESIDALQNLHLPQRMKIHLVCYEDYDSWILGKIARRLFDELDSLGMEVSLGKAPDPAAEINHHIVYFDYIERKATVETVMITHINDERELKKVGRQLIDLGVEMGICMSYEAVRRLAHLGIPEKKLCFINPAHDSVMQPRKTLVGLTTRLYPDGCKREHLLQELGERISPEDFNFAIMGAGWEAIVSELRGRGFAVEYFAQFDYATYNTLMPTFDYYLYPGQDEGSMGFLDALAAGVPTIVTAQGFHLDLPGGITHAFNDLSELQRIFSEIADLKKRRVQAVSALTWREYACNHLAVWEHLICEAAGRETPAGILRKLKNLGNGMAS